MAGRAFVTGFVVGAVAGFVAAVLTAPQSGKEVRAELKSRGIELRQQAERITEEAQRKATETLGETERCLRTSGEQDQEERQGPTQ